MKGTFAIWIKSEAFLPSVQRKKFTLVWILWGRTFIHMNLLPDDGCFPDTEVNIISSKYREEAFLA